MREKNFENKVTKFFESVGVYRLGTPTQKKKIKQVGNYFKVWGGGYQQAGIPDLICNINGYFVALELKGKGGKPSVLQTINIKSIKESNGIAKIVYPDDFEELKKLVKELIKWDIPTVM